jgi:hypothetical protein
MRQSSNIFDYTKSNTFQTSVQTIEVTNGKYKGISISERYTSPNHWGRKSRTEYLVDLVLPIGSYPNLSEDYYTAEGYGMPVFSDLEKTLDWIDEYVKKNK